MSERDTTEAAARRWVEGYEKAWASNDEGDIRALFREDAEYRTEPWSQPWSGADAIVAGWLEARDEPGDYTFEWDVIGVDGDRTFVQGRTVYRADETGADERDYSNLWVIDLDPDGRARSFTEWYSRRRA